MKSSMAESISSCLMDLRNDDKGSTCVDAVIRGIATDFALSMSSRVAVE